MNKLLPVTVALLAMASCSRPPQLPQEPHITGYELNKTEVTAFKDTLIVRIDYEDGDGDIGPMGGDVTDNAFLIDSRTNFPFGFTIPELNTTGVPQAISGSVWFKFSPNVVVCSPVPPGRLRDTFNFEIHIMDKKGNESNRIVTDDVIVLCNP